MKNLVMSALVLGALTQAAGCIFVSDDTTDGTGSIDATWNLNDTYTDDGVTAGCDGATGVIINVRAAGTTGEPDFTDFFEGGCSDGGGGTATDIPLGSWDVWVDIVETDRDSALYMESEIGTVNLDSDGDTSSVIFEIENVNGFFDVAWTLSGAATSCSQVPGEDGVGVLTTLVGTQEGLDERFPNCEDGSGVTYALPIGPYVVVVDLLNSARQSLGTSGPINSEIQIGNEFVLLDVNITVD